MAAFTKRRFSSGALDTRTTRPTGHRIVDDPFSISSLLVPKCCLFTGYVLDLGKVLMILEYCQSLRGDFTN